MIVGLGMQTCDALHLLARCIVLYVCVDDLVHLGLYCESLN